jgi:hypothetical protein
MQESRRAYRFISASSVSDVQAGGVYSNLFAGNVRKREGKGACRMNKMRTGNAHV